LPNLVHRQAEQTHTARIVEEVPVDLTALIAYACAAAALLWLPGPDWAFMVAVGTRERLVAPAVTGLAIGYVLMALVVAAGVGPLVAAAPAALVVITILGASYLIYLGIGVLRSAGHAQHTADDGAFSSDAGRLLRRGIGVSALNPKSLVLFVAFLPQFVRPTAPWPLTVQLVVLGLVWAAMGAIFYAGLGYAAQKTLGARPNLAQAVARLAGAAMILGGIALVAEQAVHALSSTA
jgi:threonine/homoserine/homoserine lactone efflux protein